MRLDPTPLIPDGDEARRWAEQELSRPEYAAAEPTPLDRVAAAVADFFGSLFRGDASFDTGPWVLVVVLAAVVAIVVISFIVWGRPRAKRRADAATVIFGTSETRSAAELRVDADEHARAGRWSEAVVLRTRALARGLEQRALVSLTPGTTVHAFARSATTALPGLGFEFARVADLFDDVRYAGRAADADDYAAVRTLDDTAQETRPVLTEAASA